MKYSPERMLGKLPWPIKASKESGLTSNNPRTYCADNFGISDGGREHRAGTRQIRHFVVENSRCMVFWFQWSIKSEDPSYILGSK